MKKIDEKFETALEVNNICRALALGDEAVYKFRDMQVDAFTMLSGMLHFGLIGSSDFEEAWNHVIDLGSKCDY